MKARLCCGALALLLCGGPRAARAQAASPAPWGLFAVRFDTRTSDFIYSVYGYGKTFGMVGVLYNPRSKFNELLGAAGQTVTMAGQTQFVAAGAALENGLWYTQVYFLPTVQAGPVWVRATSEWDAPISRGGTNQFSLSPVSGTMALNRLFQAGVGADVAMAAGSKTNLDVGPELRLALPKATLILDAQRGLDIARGRIRLSFTGAF